MKNHILYISATLPTPGFGSSVIFYRYLKRLEGWKVSIASFKQEPKEKYHLPSEWQIIGLPELGLRYPVRGARFSFLTHIRMKPIINKCLDALKDNKPSAILNQLGKNSILAYYLSKKLNVPLNIVIHDRWQVWAKAEIDKLFMTEERAIKILNHASRIWAVSDELAKFYKVSNPEKIKVLYPIPEGNPEGFVEWKESFKINPVIGFTGSFHSPQIEHFRNLAVVLEEINGRLVIVTKKNDLIKSSLLREEISSIDYHGAFSDSKEVIRFMRERVSAMLVCGSIDPRAAGSELSFPSRLVEFTHLGVPMIIIAAPDTALSNWAKKHNWLAFSESGKIADLRELVFSLQNKDSWLKMAEQPRAAALGEFNPEKIQQ